MKLLPLSPSGQVLPIPAGARNRLVRLLIEKSAGKVQSKQ
jgi:hypothetical protein